MTRPPEVAILPWGVFDTVDQCWLGTNEHGTGPSVFGEERVAMAARIVYTARFEYASDRLVLRRWMPEDAASVREKDIVEPALSYADAMALLSDPMQVSQ